MFRNDEHFLLFLIYLVLFLQNLIEKTDLGSKGMQWWYHVLNLINLLSVLFKLRFWFPYLKTERNKWEENWNAAHHVWNKSTVYRATCKYLMLVLPDSI
jgi:hypothetical protein